MSARSFPDADAKTKSYVVDVPGIEGPRVRILWHGGAVSVTLPRGATQLTVGRSKACDLCVDHASVSRRHLVVHASACDAAGARHFDVEDLGGSNGTRVNGTAVPPSARQPIAPGDVVELGGAVLIVQRGGSETAVTDHTARPVVEAGLELRETAGAPVLCSEAMQSLYRTIDLVGPSRINVLLVGETGTGKEVAARALHMRSPRAGAPFIPVNCASMPEQLLESELFGFERGAFTGADRAKRGLIEAASGGTLLLDEMGEMPLATQAKLLRVLEQREVWSIGSLRGRPIDTRFIAATNRSLEDMVEQGKFRRDLLFRLDGLTLRLPPLRQRVEDIAPLSRLFAERAAQEQGSRVTPSFTQAAAEYLRAYPWPGNVRELRHAVERAVLLAQGRALDVEHFHLASRAAEVGPSTLPPAATASDSGPLAMRKVQLERDAIVAALETTRGNQTRAAELLGMSRRTLVKRLREYELPRPRAKG